MTRDGRAFASAILEDFSGQVEVMVWAKVYVETRDLWQGGNEIVVHGKVRLRNDQVQLNCDHVRRYQIESEQDEGVVTPQPIKASIVSEEATADTAPAESRRLVISISQTSDKDTDIAYLYKLIDALKEFPGHDTVNLRVTNEEKIINLKLSNMHIGYCLELHQRLVELVGEDGLRVEPI
jgi:DNA polymerase-3 subunit alpha